MIDAAQIRAARALLDWNRDQLAAASGVSVPALAKIEGEKSTPHADTLNKVQGALEQAGVVFGDSSGVKKKNEIVTVYEGKEGLKAFFDDVYLTIKNTGSEILIGGGVQEDFFNTMGPEFLAMHAERLRAIKVKIRALKIFSHYEEGGMDYVEFRYLPDHMFVSVPFYLYHNKFAIIIWNPKIRIIVLDDVLVAQAYEKQFDVMWRIGKRTPDA